MARTERPYIEPFRNLQLNYGVYMPMYPVASRVITVLLFSTSANLSGLFHAQDIGHQATLQESKSVVGYLAPGQDEYPSHILFPAAPLRITANAWRRLQSRKINPPCGGQDFLSYMIHVSANGLVEDATLLPYESWCNDRKSPPNPPIFIQQHLGEAQTLLKQARFRPWVVEGRPTPVAISSGIIIAPPERYGAPRPFPSPIKRSSVLISMKQMGCEGKCPAYRLTLHGDGTLEYEGLAFVSAMGKRTSRIAPEVVDDLVRQFKEADFFSALPEYRGAFDGGETLLQISFDGTSHKVNDALGFSAGLPTSIRDLEWSIYRATNVGQWVYGTK
jgi:hypothetical protein